MQKWERIYNIFVVATLIVAIVVLGAGVVTYFAEDGDWPTFLVAVATIVACGALAIAVIWLGRRVCRFSRRF